MQTDGEMIVVVFVQTGGGSFVLLGMQSPKVGIVPTDVVMEKVQVLAKDMLCTREMKHISTSVDAAAYVHFKICFVFGVCVCVCVYVHRCFCVCV